MKIHLQSIWYIFFSCLLLCCSGTQSGDGHDEEHSPHLQHQGTFELLTGSQQIYRTGQAEMFVQAAFMPNEEFFHPCSWSPDWVKSLWVGKPRLAQPGAEGMKESQLLHSTHCV